MVVLEDGVGLRADDCDFALGHGIRGGVYRDFSLNAMRTAKVSLLYMRRVLAFVFIAACAHHDPPAPAVILPAPSASVTASAEVVDAGPPLTITSIERACAEPGEDDAVVAITKLDACPPGPPKHALNCQGSYDGWSLWYGKEEDATGARRAGCPTAIVCRDPRKYRDWSTTRHDLMRTVIDRAEARGQPKVAPRGGESTRPYACMM